MKRKVILLMTTIAMGITLNAVLFINTKASISGYSESSIANKPSIITKRTPIYKIHTGNSEADNTGHQIGYLSKGTYVKTSNYIMSDSGHIIKSGKYKPSTKTFYMIPKRTYRILHQQNIIKSHLTKNIRWLFI